MTDTKKISHSAWKKYHTCPKLYDLHYNEELRPSGTTSALVFGSAIDDALNELLINKTDPVKAFQKVFKFEDMLHVTWDPKDYDPGIFTTEQAVKIEGEPFEYKAWASMRIKGRMLLQAYMEKIYPLIEEVHSVQKELEGRPGILDVVATITGHGKVLIDHKTSKRPYRNDAVVNDTQLPLYAASEGLTKAGFIVMVKEINKNRVKTCTKCGFSSAYSKHKTCPHLIDGLRCHGTWSETTSPEATLQIIIDDIPEHNKKLVTDSIHETEKLIAAGVFPRNLGACGKIYGKPCPYHDYCWKNNKHGLEKKDAENKDNQENLYAK